MKALVLGIGLQGKAVVYDLDKSSLIQEIVAADLDKKAVEKFIEQHNLSKVKAAGLNADDESELSEIIQKSGAQIVICMLPVPFALKVATAALEAKIPFVNTSYAGRVSELNQKARQMKVTILPEMGLDPGIDLILAGLAIEELDEVHGLYSYGTGVPEPSCADDNPLKYKITWTFEGVLNAYRRPARLLKNGFEISISHKDIFRDEYTHNVEIPGLGLMEAYPNGDAISFVKAFGLGPNLKHMGRFAMRWPGHCAFWGAVSKLGFLENEPVEVDGCKVKPFDFLVNHLTPRLQYDRQERDLVVLRIHAWGVKDGRQRNVIYELIDRRDLKTGFFAMNRTVGFTASVAAQMILDGTIQEHGVLSPIKHVPAQAMLQALKQRDIQISHRWEG